MSTISQYTFTNAFNTDKLTQRQVQEMGVQSYTIQAADTDGNGELSFEEIIANTTLCDEIMAYIASTNATTQQAAPKEVQQAPQEEPSISYEA